MQLPNNRLCPFLFLFFLFCSLVGVAFSMYSVSKPVPFCMKSTLYVFLPVDVFLPYHHGLNFGISLFRLID